MAPLQIFALVAIAILAVKLVTSLLDRDIAIVSLATSGVLLAFIGFELWKLGGALLERFAY
ncbi:hypothetical protein [Synechococcus sp. PCC 7336]|uniref:hypothetical protein n=1 Tax=Synechococcus sp. PCC 7336 TaxID=195250 RepID=UPI000346A1B8|nr:hypothetical protein [Synechococcus sp. PCC 7336]